METKNCKHCRKPFPPNSGNQIYCEAACRIAATWPSGKRPPRPEQECKECGTSFSPTSAHQHRCRQCIDANPLPPDRRPNPRWRDGVCPGCGSAFKKVSPTQAYCAAACKDASRRPDRQCRTCGKTFDPIAAQQYCGDPCESPSASRTKRKGGQCLGCGKRLEDGRQKYCSPNCRYDAREAAWKARQASQPKREPYSRHCERCGIRWFPGDKKVKATLCGPCREEDRLNHVYSTKKAWRNAVKNRAENLCEQCGATEQDAGHYHHAHHIKPRYEGGKNTLANGKLLCVNCHDGAHGGQAVGGSPLPQGLSDDDVNRIAERMAEVLSEQAA